MDDATPAPLTPSAAQAGDESGSTAGQDEAPHEVPTARTCAEAHETAAGAEFAWPEPGTSLRIGLRTVTGMAVHEGPPFYRLT